MLVIAGKVMMDRNAPDGLRDTPQSGYDDSKALIAAWHGKGRALYAITPRFAITSSPEQMQMAGQLAAGVGFGRCVLPDVQSVPRIRPVRLPAPPDAAKAATDRHGN